MSVLRFPPNIQWELTSECNHDCIHCYNYWRKDFEKIAGMPMAKSEDEYLAIARKIIEQKPVSVILTGGEPLYAFDKIKSSILLLKNEGIVVTFNTNAVLLNDAICEFLKQYHISLFVSLPCAEPDVCDLITNTKGSFIRIVKGLDLAFNYGIKFSNNIVVSKKNIDYVDMTVRFLKERYDAKYVSITRVSKPINSDESFNSWLLGEDGIKKLQDISVMVHDKYQIEVGTACPYTPCSIYTQDAFDLFGFKKLCTAGKTSYTIDTNGNIKACPRDSRLYGNILTEDFAEIWERMSEWRNTTFIPDDCKQCKELPRCLGGCRVDSIPLSGRSDALDLISNPSNLPIKFKTHDAVRNFEDMSFLFDKDSIRSVRDNDFYRISKGRNYIMATDELYDFLFSHSSFSFDDVRNMFGIDSKTANMIIGRLLSNDIIHKNEERR